MRRIVFITPKNKVAMKDINGGHPILWVDELCNIRMLCVIPDKKTKTGRSFIWMDCTGCSQWRRVDNYEKAMKMAIETKGSTVYHFTDWEEMYYFIARHGR